MQTLPFKINKDTPRQHFQAGLWPTFTWFLEIVFVCDVGISMCVCVHPGGYKSHSHDIEPVQQVEQVCYV